MESLLCLSVFTQAKRLSGIYFTMTYNNTALVPINTTGWT